jgi:O-acetyl-ADP-ribose deacetylase (regulator of RNase III)
MNPTQVICSDKRKNSMFLEAFDSDANVQHYRCPQLNCNKGITITASGTPAYWLGDRFFVYDSEGKHSTMSASLQTFLDGRVLILVGNITAQHVDAIVNAANSTLLGGGGVDGAIHRRGGLGILEECRKLRASQFPRGLPTGQAAITTAGALPAKHVIHTVGPIAHGSDHPDAELLASCYRNSLALAAQHALRSIAFPAISTGAYGYPREQAAPVVSSVIESFFHDPGPIQEVRLVFYDPTDAQIFLQHHQFSLV